MGTQSLCVCECTFIQIFIYLYIKNFYLLDQSLVKMEKKPPSVILLVVTEDDEDAHELPSAFLLAYCLLSTGIWQRHWHLTVSIRFPKLDHEDLLLLQVFGLQLIEAILTDDRFGRICLWVLELPVLWSIWSILLHQHSWSLYLAFW